MKNLIMIMSLTLPQLAHAGPCKIVNTVMAEHGVQIECAGKTYWTDWSEVPANLKGGEFASNAPSPTFNFTSTKIFDSASGKKPVQGPGGDLISTAMPGQNCTYTSDRFNGGNYVIRNGVSGGENCKQYSLFTGFQIAKLTCGGGFDQIVICPAPEERGKVLDPQSCYNYVTSPRLKKSYLGDQTEPSAKTVEWADPTQQVVGEYKPSGSPTLITLQGKKICYGVGQKGSSSATIVGPVDNDGKCNFKTLLEDTCFSPGSVVVSEKTEYTKEIGNSTAPSMSGPGSNDSSKKAK